MNTKCLNKTQALLFDKYGDFYVDLDEESNLYCIFGTESGFAYSSFSDKEEAKGELTKFLERIKHV